VIFTRSDKYNIILKSLKSFKGYRVEERRRSVGLSFLLFVNISFHCVCVGFVCSIAFFFYLMPASQHNSSSSNIMCKHEDKLYIKGGKVDKQTISSGAPFFQVFSTTLNRAFDSSSHK